MRAELDACDVLVIDDLDVFIERIQHGAGSYVADERILHVLSLVDAIDSY